MASGNPTTAAKRFLVTLVAAALGVIAAAAPVATGVEELAAPALTTPTTVSDAVPDARDTTPASAEACADGGVAATDESAAAAEAAPITPVAAIAPLVTPEAALAAAATATGLPSSEIAVAVVDLATGTEVTWGTADPQVTASIVKVDILMTLLLQRQDEGATLTATQRELAIEMITESDNDAATALWNEIGQGDGLAEANARFGLTSTVPGDGGYWGLTETTPTDQVRLLAGLASSNEVLSDTNRAYVLSLMSSVDPDQAWGVSAAGTAALKNGWLDRPDGTWAINSIGIVTTTAGNELLVAVQSHGWSTMEAGVAAVQELAAAAVATVSTGSL